MKIPVRLYKKADTSGEYEVPLEADVMRWFKKEGDAIREGDDLCELEAEKGNFSVAAPASGKLVDVKYPAPPVITWRRGSAEKSGVTIYYEPPLCFIETAEEARQDTPNAEPEKTARPKISAEALRLIRELGLTIDQVLEFCKGRPRIERGDVMDCFSTLGGTKDARAPQPPLSAPGPEALKVVPAARERARDLGLALAAIRASGPEGEILLADVEKHATTKSAEKELTQKLPVTEDGVIHLRPPRLWKTIAKNITLGAEKPVASSDAHFDFTRLVRFYRAYRERLPYALWLPVAAAAVRILSQERFILFNSYWDEENEERPVVVRQRVNLGIAFDKGQAPKINWAVESIEGDRLKILVLHRADQKTLRQLADETRGLIADAEAKKVPLDKLDNWTFIFNNIGALGHESGRSLFSGKISAMVNLGQIDLASGLGLVQIFFDHRLIDGASITPFLKAIDEELTERVIPELEELFR